MNIAIVGATGLVGREILKILNEKGYLHNNNIYLYASEKSNNKTIKVDNKSYKVKTLTIKNLKEKYDFALFSAGSDVSLKWAQEFVSRGAIVIDNSSAFRRRNNAPLVVPEINGNAIRNSKIVANPNCSTIGLAVPLYAMGKKYNIKKIIVSTYQAVSGAGQKGVNDLTQIKKEKFYYNITNNLIPQIDRTCENRYTYEEDKMNFELKKILNNNKLKISATCVRVPIVNCHSESVHVEFGCKVDLKEIKKLLYNQKGIKVLDNLKNKKYPMPLLAGGGDEIIIGRIRKDTACKNGVSFFISFDNIRKGASLNAVQIMEYIIKKRK